MKKVISLLSVLALVASSGAVLAQYSTYGGWGWGASTGSSSSSGGSSSSLQRDYCPDGDMTFSYYDGLCEEGVAAAESGTTTTTSDGTATEGTTTTTVTTSDGGPISIITTTTATEGGEVSTTDTETVMDIKEQLMNNSSNTVVPAVETISLPAFLPETGASL